MRPLVDFKLGVGPMSKNIVDACIEFADAKNVSLMLIPSRRQIEHSGGYSNNWTTADFATYIKIRSDKILIMRDHAGPKQGVKPDSGFQSLQWDCKFFNFIHIDPWKAAADFESGCEMTRKLIDYCHNLSPAICYEIGTEEAIFPYDEKQLRYFINFLRGTLSALAFSRIKFAVIQSGTALKGNENTGKFDESRLSSMVKICQEHGLLAKEHNGDYLSSELIQRKFKAGLNAINIAPEFGQIETRTYMAEMGQNMLDIFYKTCYDSGQWVKWVDSSKIPSRTEIMNVCGHYVISNPNFIALKSRMRPDIDEIIKENIIKKLTELHGATT